MVITKIYLAYIACVGYKYCIWTLISITSFEFFNSIKRLSYIIRQGYFNSIANNQYLGNEDLHFLYVDMKNTVLRQPIFIVLFIGLTILILYLVVIKMYHYTNHQRLETLKTNYKIKSLEQKALQSMMNPHFIFNALNSIQYFLTVNNDVKAQEKLSQFAKLIRLNLEICQQKLISITEEIEYLKLYLSFERLRFGDNFDYKIITSDNLCENDTFIPTIIVQPFVENAIWHGIMPNRGKGEILIRFLINPKTLVIEIFDNGIGIDNTSKKSNKHKSLGLNMTKERLSIMQDIYNDTFYFNISQINDCNENKSGTLVQIYLPNNL